jgi:hypothetical protein
MPIGLVELGVVGVGLASGYSLGSRLRQSVYDEAIEQEQADGARQRNKAEKPAAAPAHRNQDAMTLTVMLVGEPGAGKSLFCERLNYHSDGALPKETLPRTWAPQWQRVNMVLPSAGRVCFQLLDTPGSLPEVSITRSTAVAVITRGRRCSLSCCPALGSSRSPFIAACNRASSSLTSVRASRALERSVTLRVCARTHTPWRVNSRRYARMKSEWFSALRLHRAVPGGRQPPATTVVLAHIIDERRERQVTRREAAAWCQQQKLPYFEMHQAERPVPKVLAHLADVVLREDSAQER